jgi:hypothetical protein
MLSFSASKYIDVSTMLIGIGEQLSMRKGVISFALPAIEYTDLVNNIETLCDELSKLALPASTSSATEIRKLLKNSWVTPQGHHAFSPIDAARLNGAGIQLIQRLPDELQARLFLAIPSHKMPYYIEDTLLFGQKVADKFPNNVSDIAEAGKCFSMGRHTACVFHLMRIMEVAVQRFGTELGVTLTNELNWQNILDRLNPLIKGMDHRDPRTKVYAAIQTHLYNVKIAWRNEVMHPKATYDEEEATALIGAVRTFLSDLAAII